MGFDFAGVKYLAHNKDQDGVPEGDDAYNMTYEEFFAPMVGAFQELTKLVEAQNKKIEILEKNSNQ